MGRGVRRTTALAAGRPACQNAVRMSRYGTFVRSSDNVRWFRKYLRGIFTACRAAYEQWQRKKGEGPDIAQLLSAAPSNHVTQPLFRSVRNVVETGAKSFYIEAPDGVAEDDRAEWLKTYESQVAEAPFEEIAFEKHGPNAPALRYDPATRALAVNAEHPFIDKLTDGGRQRRPATLFAASEVLLEGQLQKHRMDRTATGLLRDRDRVFRLAAGDAPPTAAEVVRRINAAACDPRALERAVGAVFRVLGFEYERKGSAVPGSDGVLYAHLGCHGNALSDYSLVYGAKQTNQPAIPADKIDLAGLESFRRRTGAEFGFFIANAYAAEADDAGTLNQKLVADDACRSLTLLKIEHLRRLVWLHYRHGVTLAELRGLFEEARTTSQVDAWICDLQERLRQSEIPVSDLLHGLEREKSDPKAKPNVSVVRAMNPAFLDFEPERLVARLKAIESFVGVRWIEVNESTRDVLLHHTAEQIRVQFEHEIGVLAAESQEA